MVKKLTLSISLLLIMAGVLILSACSGGGGGSTVSRISPTWVKPEIVGDSVSISLKDVQNAKMVHFKVSTASFNETFMAYEYGGAQYIRADICPPCQSDSFSLVDNKLVCDTCGTVFDAKTGKGISGACVRYPKAQVQYTLTNGKMVMTASALEAAYKSTLIAKAP